MCVAVVVFYLFIDLFNFVFGGGIHTTHFCSKERCENTHTHACVQGPALSSL